jgi:hypothetical protein
MVSIKDRVMGMGVTLLRLFDKNYLVIVIDGKGYVGRLAHGIGGYSVSARGRTYLVTIDDVEQIRRRGLL